MWGIAETRKALSFEGASVLSKSCAEGQSRTDTGSPPPVFKFVTVRTTSPHQALYLLQSVPVRTNAFHMDAGDFQYLGDVLGYGTEVITWPILRSLSSEQSCRSLVGLQ